VRVTRSVESHSFIAIEGHTPGWPIQPSVDKKLGVRGLDVKDWRIVLGWALFGLPFRNSDQDYEPSPRSLLSYFVRSQPEAYVDPFRHFGNQKTWDIQLHNSFLLGLDWEKAARWQTLKDQKNAIDALRAAIKTGAIEGQLGSLGELEAQRVRLEAEVEREREALATFRVHPQYREIQDKADQLTVEIHAAVNANVLDRRRVTRYEQSIAVETAPDEVRLEGLYEEAGVVFPSSITKTLDEARAFHRQLVENRKHFISTEIDQLKLRISDRELTVARLTDLRAGLMTALSGHGALDELTRMQEGHTQTKQRLEDIKFRIGRLRQISAKRDEIKVATVELRKSAEVDYEERRPIWSNALLMFSDNSEALYNIPGRLVIDIKDSGYRFGVEIPGSPSEGIGKMKIFCYDLMLVSFQRQRGLGMDFLIHDSTIFDGVDPRQRAHALERGAKLSEQHAFQYICTINTDMVPIADFSTGFDYTKFIRLRLTDTDPSGSLLGIRY
jgi:uncharacterized protein YydD (DUF2326 family)